MALDFRGDERDVLIYAFRYALGRATYSVDTMVNIIIANWNNISKPDRELFKREINEAIDLKHYGMAMDKATWERILSLK
jgi:hypothetical protein